jgi:hypothetical protein
MASNGYILVKFPSHPNADVRGYVYEHRLIGAQTLGRPLRAGELVHHLNGDKVDNRPENIQIVQSIGQHLVRHRKRVDLRLPDEPNPMVECACGCGSGFYRFDASGRPRRYLPGHNLRP